MKLSHVGDDNNAKMVDVGEKTITKRVAVAEGKIIMQPQVVALVTGGKTPKGNVLNTAKVAGIMAAKNTAAIIPMCHTLPLSGIDIDFGVGDDYLSITATARVEAKTGVEMEALTAVAVAALTIYDMTKAVDKSIEITAIHLVSKSGGKSGDYKRGVL